LRAFDQLLSAVILRLLASKHEGLTHLIGQRRAMRNARRLDPGDQVGGEAQALHQALKPIDHQSPCLRATCFHSDTRRT